MECRFSFYDENEEICKACDEELRELCKIGRDKRLGNAEVEKSTVSNTSSNSKSISSVLKQIIAEGTASREGSRGIYERLCKEFPDKDKKRLYTLMHAYLSRLGIKVPNKKESKSVYGIVKDSIKKGITDVNKIHERLIKEFPDKNKSRLRSLIHAYMDKLGVKPTKSETQKEGKSIQSVVKECYNAGLNYKEMYDRVCSEFPDKDKKRLYNLIHAYISRIKKENKGGEQ